MQTIVGSNLASSSPTNKSLYATSLSTADYVVGKFQPFRILAQIRFGAWQTQCPLNVRQADGEIAPQ
jgi:hypothetical protein